jgi:hypothetical protein
MPEPLDRRVTRLEVTVQTMQQQVVSCLATLTHVDNSVRDLLDAQKDAREAEDAQYKRLGRIVQVLTLAVAAAAVIVPLALTWLRT